MTGPSILERYLKALLLGDRQQCRSVIEETLQSGIPANSVCSDVIWPIMEEIEHLVRSDRISPVQEHLASRINRTIVDQLQNKLPRRPIKGKKVIVCCAPEELQELGAQITADLFESEGWDVRFIGGGLSNSSVD
jgi:methanogenic corrinoid protein MtbC1